MAALTIFCAMLLAGSALHKAMARERLAAAAAKLAGAGPALGPVLLVLAGAVELIAAVCLLIEPLRVAGGIAAAALWAGYAIMLMRRRGETLDCGCDLNARAKPVTAMLAARPAVLSALAILVSTLPAAPVTLDAPFAAAGLLALYLGASELLAIPRPAWRTV